MIVQRGEISSNSNKGSWGNDEGLLDMEATSHNDLLDAFRLSVQF
jgi:hypothetical protein